MDNLKITGVDKDEFPVLTAIWEASVRATHLFLTDKDITYFRPLVLNDFLPMVKIFAARDSNGVILGFGGISDDKIEMLFVDPAMFGKGIGKTLLKHIIQEEKVYKLDVNEQNPSAVGFYKHMGFKVVGRSERDSLGKPFPLLHMECKRYDF
jgi:putative acetyltransferase